MLSFSSSQEEIELSIQAGELIEKVENVSVKNILQKKFEQILSIENNSYKIRELKQFLTTLQKTVEKNKIYESKKIQENSSKNIAAVNVAKEVELHNLLVEYACLLRDLNGNSVDIVRKQLQENLNNAELSSDAKKLLESLIFTCSQAETALKGLGFFEKDRKDSQASNTFETGKAVVGSLVGAVLEENPFLLIEGIVSLYQGVQQHKQINEQSKLRLEMVLAGYHANLDRLLYDLNQYRSGLTYTYKVASNSFLTKELYLQFRQGIIEKDIVKRVELLKSICGECPNFRDALYYLYSAYKEQKNDVFAEKTLLECEKHPSLIWRKDVYMAYIYGNLSYYMSDDITAIQYSNKALAIKPNYALAYNNRAVCYANLGRKEDALKDIEKVIKLESNNGFYWQNKAKILAKCFQQNEQALTALAIAIDKGYYDFAKIRAYKSFEKVFALPRAKYLLMPKLHAAYKQGIFNDDIIITNLSSYQLNNIKLEIKVICGKEKKDAKKEISRLSACNQEGSSIKFKNIFSLPNDKYKLIELIYTTEEYPQESYTNFSTNPEYPTMEDYYWKETWKLLESKPTPNYEEAYKLAKIYLEYCPDSSAWSLLSQISFALNKNVEAEAYANKAIQIAVEDIELLKWTNPIENRTENIRKNTEVAWKIKHQFVYNRVWSAYLEENVRLVKRYNNSCFLDQVLQDDITFLAASDDKNHLNALAAFLAWQKNATDANEYAKNALPETPRRVQLLLRGMTPKKVEIYLKLEKSTKN